MLSQDAHLFPVRNAYLYTPRDVAGVSQGSNYFAAPNPDFGATFTFFLREGATTLKAERREQEKAAGDGDIPFPGWDALESEQNAIADAVHVVVRDASGAVAGRVNGGSSKGLHRVSWNLRYPSKGPIAPGEETSGGDGFLVTAGMYTATLTRTSRGVETEPAGPITFHVAPLREGALKGASPEDIIAFRKEMEALQGRMALLSRALEARMDQHCSRCRRPSAAPRSATKIW